MIGMHIEERSKKLFQDKLNFGVSVLITYQNICTKSETHYFIGLRQSK